jgi:phospholipase C
MMLLRRTLIAVCLLAGCSSSPTATVGPASTTTPAATRPPSSTTAAAAPLPTTASAPAPPTEPCGSAAPAPARYDHVVWIWMENHTASSVLASDEAPFERSLATACGSADHYHSVGSPSLPNYLAAVTGSTHGVHDDGSPGSHQITGDNVFRQVTAAGGTARSYEEAMATNCQQGGGGRYAVKHNPQAYLSDAPDRAACQRDDVPLGETSSGALIDDLDAGRLPTFSFVTPDLCNDTHDCAVAVGDAWLRDWIGVIVSSSTYAAHRTAVFVVWDEPTPMPLLVVSPTTPGGATSSEPFDHYSLLRTTEELLGLPTSLGAASTAASLRATYHL